MKNETVELLGLLGRADSVSEEFFTQFVESVKKYPQMAIEMITALRDNDSFDGVVDEIHGNHPEGSLSREEVYASLWSKIESAALYTFGIAIVQAGKEVMSERARDN